ncbi:chemotaxis protein CheB [Azohydromonas australica]|uniref:chemotaxis protein CheB n=1 Tax=Azohydromonas australica TaxID=364039 RepID=UPI00146E48D1|nr:chemotaxis protein CheB [Azohydromonas australica]
MNAQTTHRDAGAFDLLVLCASLQGEAAVLDVLRALPRDFALPIVVMQPLDPGSRALQAYGACRPRPVEWVTASSTLAPGRLLVCPPGSAVELRPDGRFVLAPDEEGAPERPLDRLLESVARGFGPLAIAVLLGGPDHDGANGARRLHQAGGRVLVQDPATTTQPDLPSAAIAAGATDQVLPLSDIGHVVGEIAAGRPRPESRPRPAGSTRSVGGLAAIASPAARSRLLEAMLGSIPDFVYAFDREHRFVYVNQAMQDLFGPQARLLGHTFTDLRYPAELARRLDAHLDAIFDTGRTIEDEVFFINPAGSGAYFDFVWGPVLAEDGSVELVVGVSRDTTQRRQLEQQLRENARRLRLALDVGELATWDWDLRTGQVLWSREHYRMQGYRVGEVEPGYEAWLARVHPQDREAAVAAVREARAQRRPYRHEFRILPPDGQLRWFSAKGHFYYDDQGEAVRMIGVMRDVTEQRHASELLAQRVAERTAALRQLLIHLESVQDEERRRIARELHDGLGQYLSSVALALSALRQSPDDVAARERLHRLQGLIQELDRELDRIVFILRPTALEDCGLGEGVSAYVQTWSELTGVSTDLELHGLDHGRLTPSVETATFRVVQEALNNVAKYASASRVSLSLERRRGLLVGSIEDDGVGFDATDATTPVAGRSNWGLLGMQERIEALGGTFAIDSQPGQGTTVLWRLPVASEKA